MCLTVNIYTENLAEPINLCFRLNLIREDRLLRNSVQDFNTLKISEIQPLLFPLRRKCSGKKIAQSGPIPAVTEIMKPRKSLLLLLIVPFLMGFGKARQVEIHLGFNLMPHYPKDLVTFGIVKIHKDEIIDFQSISKREFIMIASCYQISAANPLVINYFEEYDIPFCEVEWNGLEEIHDVYCPTLNHLWKLRYSKIPDQYGNNSSVLEGETGGWAKSPFKPSDPQLAMLNEYGIFRTGDFAWGDNCFRLIKATTTPGWVSDYSK
jgi:hypothetical protein